MPEHQTRGATTETGERAPRNVPSAGQPGAAIDTLPTAVLRLQRQLGNAAVTTLLNGGASGKAMPRAVQRLRSAIVVQRDVSAADGPKVDAALDASPFIKSYVGGWAALGHTVQAALKIDDLPTFRAELIKYTDGKNPFKGGAWIPSDLDDFVSKCNGFTRRGVDIHVKQTVGIGTIVHEGMHLYQKAVFPFNVSEGFTEFLTRWLCAQAKLPRDPNYQSQLDAVDRLAATTDQDKIGDAYFLDKQDALKADVNKVPGRWDAWVTKMTAADYAGANALFAPSGLSSADRGILESVFSASPPVGPVPGGSKPLGASAPVSPVKPVAPVKPGAPLKSPAPSGGAPSGAHAPGSKPPSTGLSDDLSSEIEKLKQSMLSGKK